MRPNVEDEVAEENKVLWALRHWANSAKLHRRQSDHMKVLVTPDELPPEETILANMLTQEDIPAVVLSDAQQDREAELRLAAMRREGGHAKGKGKGKKKPRAKSALLGSQQ